MEANQDQEGEIFSNPSLQTAEEDGREEGDVPSTRPEEGGNDSEQGRSSILLSAVIVPNENDVADRVRELEKQRRILELEQKAVEQAILEDRRQMPRSVSALAVEKIDDADTSSRPHRRKFPLLLLGLLGMVVLGGTIFGILRRRNKDQRNPGGDAPPSTSSDSPIVPTVPVMVTDLVNLLSTEYSNLDTEPLLTDGTPQNRAISWMTLEDDWTEDAMTTADIPIQMIGERYSLAVIYFATDGDQWSDHEVKWLLNTTSVCEWNNVTGSLDDVSTGSFDEVTTTRGVSCNDDGMVVTLDLSE